MRTDLITSPLPVDNESLSLQNSVYLITVTVDPKIARDHGHCSEEICTQSLSLSPMDFLPAATALLARGNSRFPVAAENYCLIKQPNHIA